MKPEQQAPCPGQCRPDEHRLHRRLFLKGLPGGVIGALTVRDMDEIMLITVGS